MPSSLDGMHETCERGMSNLPRHPGMACKRSVLRPASALADNNRVSEAIAAAWTQGTLPGTDPANFRVLAARKTFLRKKK